MPIDKDGQTYNEKGICLFCKKMSNTDLDDLGICDSCWNILYPYKQFPKVIMKGGIKKTAGRLGKKKRTDIKKVGRKIKPTQARLL